MAGIQDCWTAAKGCTATLGNFGMLIIINLIIHIIQICFSLICLAKATYAAMAATYSYLTPDLWKESVYTKTPYQEYSDFLSNAQKKYTVGMGHKNY